MQERFLHSHPCKPLGWLQQTAARPSRHSPGMHSGTDSHTPAENTPAQTHTLLMTRHPNHPNRPTNDRRTPDQHTIGTQQHVRACTDMQERFQHSHPCKPLSWLQRTTARPSRHSPGMHSGTGSHTPAESSPATNSQPAHDATPKPPQQTNQWPSHTRPAKSQFTTTRQV